ncbi:MAG TPA: hypothetical protein VLJ11_10095 [Bryobacteraceae bacterium]|nr:hypothetical protein [Bryobacteraceae bacterium]
MNSVAAIPFLDSNLPKPVRVTPKAPSHDAVRKQLSIILQSPGFIHANRMGRFLQFIVEETLAGRSSQLRGYSIGMSVFDRNESFEPGIDPIVRNEARRLRQKLLEYYQQSRYRDDTEIIIDIPKGTYVPVFGSATRSQQSSAARQYRLIISLIRIEDGVEILHSQHEY